MLPVGHQMADLDTRWEVVKREKVKNEWQFAQLPTVSVSTMILKNKNKARELVHTEDNGTKHSPKWPGSEEEEF